MITFVDVSGCGQLTSLNCSSNLIETLDLSKNPCLSSLVCKNNRLTSLDLTNNEKIGKPSILGNTYEITLSGNTFDLSSLPGNFDVNRASLWKNAELNGSVINVKNVSETITYMYDLGNGISEKFTLIPVGSLIQPGDVNADGKFNTADISALKKYLLCDGEAELADESAADICDDGKINIFDFNIMKKI